MKEFIFVYSVTENLYNWLDIFIYAYTIKKKIKIKTTFASHVRIQ